MVFFLKNLFSRSLFRELSWYAIAQIVVQAVAFVSVIIVARYLGPINLGLYSFVQNYAGAFLTIIGGMDFYFTWKIAKSDDYPRDLREYIGHKFNIYVTLALVGIVAAWVVLPRDVSFMVTILLAPVFIQSLNAFSYYAVATNRAKLMATVQMSSALLLLVFKIGLVFAKAPLYLFVAVSAVDMIISGMILTLYFIGTPEGKAAFSPFKLPSFVTSYLFLFSVRSSIVAIMLWQLLLRVDQLILATISNAYTLGIYSAAVKIAEVPNFLAGVLSAALVSRMAYISQRDDAVSKEKLNKIMLYYLLTGILIAIGIIIFAPLAIHILYGGKFAGSVPVLRAYSLSIPGMFMNYFFLGMYGAKDRQHHQVLIFGIALAVNIGLIYILTPVFGITGTAFATAIAYSVAALGFFINLKR